MRRDHGPPILLTARLLGPNVRFRHCPVPVPDTYTVWGLLLAVSLTTIFADSGVPPPKLGVKVTVMVQGARFENPLLTPTGQLFVTVKSPGSDPIT